MDENDKMDILMRTVKRNNEDDIISNVLDMNKMLAPSFNRKAVMILANRLHINTFKTNLPVGKVITLCGSVRFKNIFTKWDQILTLSGNAVISIVCFDDNSKEIQDHNVRKLLSITHKMKIDASDVIFVINQDNYIGESTKMEIDYATSIGRAVRYLTEYE